MWHLIIDGVVQESTNIDPSGRFHESLVWIESNEIVQHGWIYDGEKFTDPHKSNISNKVHSVTKAQGKAALIQSGLWGSVVDYVESISDATEKSLAEVALNDTTTWQRSSPFLNSAAKAIGLNDSQLDQLFIDASEIEL